MNGLPVPHVAGYSLLFFFAKLLGFLPIIPIKIAPAGLFEYQEAREALGIV